MLKKNNELNPIQNGYTGAQNTIETINVFLVYEKKKRKNSEIKIKIYAYASTH